MADLVADMLADMLDDIVADMKVDKVADMFFCFVFLVDYILPAAGARALIIVVFQKSHNFYLQ